MDDTLRKIMHDLGSSDDAVRFAALTEILRLTDRKVEWFEEVREELAAKLTDENSYQRSVGIMVLCNLAKSDRRHSLGALLPAILSHTRDEKFITSRQCIRNVWKLGVHDAGDRRQIVDHLSARFSGCGQEPHGNLLRLDIIGALDSLYRETREEEIRVTLESLIGLETDEKNRKKLKAAVSAR